MKKEIDNNVVYGRCSRKMREVTKDFSIFKGFHIFTGSLEDLIMLEESLDNSDIENLRWDGEL